MNYNLLEYYERKIMRNLTYTWLLILIISTLSIQSCKRVFDPVSVVPKIAYRSNHQNIFLMDMDGSNKVNLTKDRYHYIQNIRFFPDGKKIVFDYQQAYTVAIKVIDLEGNIILENPKISGFYRNHWNPFVSPDGLYIAFLLGAGNQPGPICILNIENNDDSKLVAFDENYWYLQFSPDGNSIIYGNSTLWSMNISDTSKIKISDIPGRFHKYTPDGSKIVFQITDHTHPNVSLCVMDSDGNNLKELNSNYLGNDEFDISPDGSMITYMGTTDEIFTIGIDGSNQTCLTKNVASWNPKFSPNGKKIVFTAYRDIDSGPYDIFIMDVDGKNRKNLTLDGGYNDDRPVFQPINIY